MKHTIKIHLTKTKKRIKANLKVNDSVQTRNGPLHSQPTPEAPPTRVIAQQYDAPNEAQGRLQTWKDRWISL